MDFSDDSWRDTFFGNRERGALLLLICGAIEKHLLTWVTGQGLSRTTYSIVISGRASIQVQDSWRNGQLWSEVGRPCHRHYVKSWKETVVHETVEKSRRLSGWSVVLLSGSCVTCSRICEPMLADKSYERTDETTRCSASCSSDHFWQHTVRRSTSYM